MQSTIYTSPESNFAMQLTENSGLSVRVVS